jgi:hypothetical protein
MPINTTPGQITMWHNYFCKVDVELRILQVPITASALYAVVNKPSPDSKPYASFAFYSWKLWCSYISRTGAAICTAVVVVR